MSKSISTLEEQRKLIEFLTSKYEKDTGRKIEIPSTLGQLLEDDSIVAEEQKPKVEQSVHAMTFAEAVEALRLPKGEPPKKGEKKKVPV